MNRKILILVFALLLLFVFGCKKEGDTDIDNTGSVSESRTDTAEGETATKEPSVDVSENEGDSSTPIDRPNVDRDGDVPSGVATDAPDIGVKHNDDHDSGDAWTTEATDPPSGEDEQAVSDTEGSTVATDDSERLPENDEDKGYVDFRDCTYEEYLDMSATDQQEFFAKFDSYETFFEWYNDAKDEYEKENPDNIIDGGEIDLNEIIGN